MRVSQLTPILISLYGTVLAAPQATSPAASSGPPTVTIDSGVVQGISTSIPGAPQNVTKYLGVPFAAKPVRFAPAASPQAWKTPFNATKYGPACIQDFAYPAHDITIAWFNTPPPPAGESEDCLNVNVYVPAMASNKTVMVWFYGVSVKGVLPRRKSSRSSRALWLSVPILSQHTMAPTSPRIKT